MKRRITIYSFAIVWIDGISRSILFLHLPLKSPAEEHGLIEKYGTRILVNIASALEMTTGQPVLTTLNGIMKQFDGEVQQELRTFIAKIGGGF